MDPGDTPGIDTARDSRLALIVRHFITRRSRGPHPVLDRESASVKPEVRPQMSAWSDPFRDRD